MVFDLQNAWELENNDNVACNFGKFKVFPNHLNCGKIGSIGSKNRCEYNLRNLFEVRTNLKHKLSGYASKQWS